MALLPICAVGAGVAAGVGTGVGAGAGILIASHRGLSRAKCSHGFKEC